MTVLIYQTEADTTWSGSFSDSEIVWQLDTGESRTETVDIEPSEVGVFNVGLMTNEEEVLTEWDLTVVPPMLSLGETQSYYDGLDLTVDAHRPTPWK